MLQHEIQYLTLQREKYKFIEIHTLKHMLPSAHTEAYATPPLPSLPRYKSDIQHYT
jgi:hypothetical protein